MSAFNRNLREKITRWSAIPDGYSGHTFSTPQILDGRWEDKNELVKTPNGEEIVSQAMVSLSGDVQIGDWLYRGESSEADPTTLDGSKGTVKAFMKSTDLRNLNVRRKAVL